VGSYLLGSLKVDVNHYNLTFDCRYNYEKYTTIKDEEKRNAYRLLVGKPEGKRPLGRPRRR
jgi:hypothetical protein